MEWPQRRCSFLVVTELEEQLNPGPQETSSITAILFWGFLSRAFKTQVGANTCMMICNVLQRWCKNRTGSIVWLKNCNYAFPVHSHTLRRHSRGLSIHFRPSLSLIYNAGRIHEHTTQPPNTSAIKRQWTLPLFPVTWKPPFLSTAALRCLVEVTAAKAGFFSDWQGLLWQVCRPTVAIPVCRKHIWIKYELASYLYLIEHVERVNRHFFLTFLVLSEHLYL